MSTSTHILCALVAVSLLSGCDDVGANSAPSDAPVESRWTQVTVQRESARHGDSDWDVEAWFAQYSGATRGALRDAMGALATPDEGCTLLPGRLNQAEMDSVRFRAIGTAQLVDEDGDRSLLDPRALSVRTDAISGVVYRGATSHHDSSPLHFEVMSSEGSPQLAVPLRPPSGHGWVAVNQQPLDATTGVRTPFELSSDADLTLQIDSDADVAFVYLRSAYDSHAPRLACRIENDELSISASQLDSFGPAGSLIDVQLVLRNETALTLDGVHVGEASMELNDRLTIQRLLGE